MIDISQLTSLISAFRVETEKESISPETVGKLLQDILDLLATASTDAERQVLDDWKAMLSQYTVVYDVAHATGMADMEHMYLTMKSRSMRNCATFTSSVPLYGATDLQAGVMTAAHVQTLMALQASLPQVRSALTALQTTAQQHGWQLAAIRAAGYVVTDIRQGTGHASKINLSLSKHDVRMATKRTEFTERATSAALGNSGTSSELHSLARGVDDDGGQNYNPQYMPIVLITDFTCEIHDRDGELNSVKFTYQYNDRRPYLPQEYLSVDNEKYSRLNIIQPLNDFFVSKE